MSNGGQLTYREIPSESVMLFWIRDQLKSKDGVKWARKRIKKEAVPVHTDWSDPDSVISTMLLENHLDDLFLEMVSELDGYDVLHLLERLHSELSDLVMRYEQYEMVH
jgi:hypothetical protein